MDDLWYPIILSVEFCCLMSLSWCGCAWYHGINYLAKTQELSKPLRGEKWTNLNKICPGCAAFAVVFLPFCKRILFFCLTSLEIMFINHRVFFLPTYENIVLIFSSISFRLPPKSTNSERLSSSARYTFQANRCM